MVTTRRPAVTHWKTMRTGITALTDDDWADDESDALPTAGVKGIPFYSDPGLGRHTHVEFVVIGYVNATRFVSDNDADTFSVDVTYLIEAPTDSSLCVNATLKARTGNATGDRRVAIRQASTAGFRYFEVNTIECHGADQLVLRLHTSTGAPGAADRYEVWYREAVR